jgi:hypothetical protein
MPVEELLVHLPDLIKIWEVRRGLWVYFWAVGENRFEEQAGAYLQSCNGKGTYVDDYCLWGVHV